MSTAERAKRVRPLLLAAGVWAAVNLLDLFYPVFFDTWNERLSDQFLALKTAIPAFAPPYDEAVVHVDLNNTSLRALKDYHPTRAHYARVIHNLGAMKVAVQMCDVIFAGETGPENDRRLMEATRQSRDVVFGMAFRLSAAEEADEGVEDPEARSYLRKTAWKLPAAPETARFYHGVDPLITLVPLAELSLGTGFLTLIPDADGVMRRLPLIARFEDGFYPSFALKSVCAFLKVPPERVALERGAIILLDAVLPRSGRKARLTLPVDARGCLRINFVGAWGRMRHYNFSDIYAASDDPDRLDEFREELEGRIALVSDISTGSADMGQVPIDETYPLSGVHANAVNTILTGSFIRELPSLAKAGTELLLLLAVTALSFHRSALVSSAGTVGLGGLFTISAGLALLNWNLMIPAAKPLVVMVLGWAGLSTWNALENARVRAEIERARQLAERELEIGRQIQTGFLPAKLPVPPGWEIAAHFQPALQVSGDFYDVFEVGGSRCLAVVIADVCDHGVGSALFMALIRSLIRAFALQSAARLDAATADPAGWSDTLALEAVRQTNAYIADTHGDAGMFATLFLGILDPQTGRLTYVNGGHEPPLFLSRGQPAAHLKATGLAVGALPEATFRTGSVSFHPGDCLVLYTDGVTDADDGTGTHFSKPRLIGLVEGKSDPAGTTLENVIAALNAHVGKNPPADDITLLVLRKAPAS
ncbi:MAG TPA: SpoIIE family protein phosphatase [Desulfobacterales bacterium]|nr:SpoIIE family protein phosphatase [Desulfobacterales bacterium]